MPLTNCIMFGKKKQIVYLASGKIFIETVTLGKNPKRETKQSFDWNYTTLPQVLLEVKKITGGIIRLLLSEDFVYVANIAIPFNLPSEKSQIIDKVREFIPENIEETIWDYKAMLYEENPKSGQKEKIIQIEALPGSFHTLLANACTQAKLTIESAEAVSIALARQLRHEENPVLVVFVPSFGSPISFLALQGLVIGSKKIENEINSDAIQAIIAYGEKHFNVTPAKIIFSGNIENINVESFKTELLTAERATLDPIVSLAAKQDIHGKFEETLNIEIIPTAHKNQEAHTEQPSKKSVPPLFQRSPIKILLAFLGVLMLAGSTIFLALLSPKLFSQPNPSVTAVKTLPTPSKTHIKISPAPTLNFSRYTVTVLNGSNKEGEAGKLKNFLASKGFIVIKTDNAVSQNYEKTIIRYQTTVDSAFRNALHAMLQDTYTLDNDQVLNDPTQSDVVIIIGAK